MRFAGKIPQRSICGSSNLEYQVNFSPYTNNGRDWQYAFISRA